MKKIIIIVVLVMSLVGVLFAGIRNIRETKVIKYSYGGGCAYGVPSYARYSSNTKEYIGCQVYAYYAKTFVFTICHAQDKIGTSISGYTFDDKYVKVISSVNNDTFIRFVVDGKGKITFLTTYHSSAYIR